MLRPKVMRSFERQYRLFVDTAYNGPTNIELVHADFYTLYGMAKVITQLVSYKYRKEIYNHLNRASRIHSEVTAEYNFNKYFTV